MTLDLESGNLQVQFLFFCDFSKLMIFSFKIYSYSIPVSKTYWKKDRSIESSVHLVKMVFSLGVQ